MAPEMLDLNKTKFSKATDVFAYGVLMWEITTQEKPEVHVDEKTTTRLWGQPIDTDVHTFPDYMLKLLPLCWKEDHHERPTITEIIEQLPKGQYIVFINCT